MASKASPAADAPEATEEQSDAPLLDTSVAAVKKMLTRAKERGYVTYGELNAALPQDQMTSEQIEDVMAMLSEMGINVVDNEDDGEEQAGSQRAVAAE